MRMSALVAAAAAALALAGAASCARQITADGMAQGSPRYVEGNLVVDPLGTGATTLQFPDGPRQVIPAAVGDLIVAALFYKYVPDEAYLAPPYSISDTSDNEWNALPPTFCAVLNTAVVANGALALFCCPMIASVAVSNMLEPAMNFDPSGETEITLEAPDTVRLRSTTCDADSYTKR